VRIYRFDEEIAIQDSEFGSRAKLGPLVGDGANARVQVVYLPPDGLMGRTVTPVRQLFAVVIGAGTVSGSDAERRDIGPGYAALWEEGEEREVRSNGGLTAISVEGDFETWALGVTIEIVVTDYDPAWPSWFEEVGRRVWPAVEDIALRIDHVGSTAVPGLAAKPIIDLDIVVGSEDGVRPVIDRLSSLGYRWRGDLGVAGREAFEPAPEDSLPEHHLYLVVENNRAHVDHWLLRDLLREDGDARARYAALKKRNVELASGDMDVYIAAKAALVAELLTRARAEKGLPPETYWEPVFDNS